MNTATSLVKQSPIITCSKCAVRFWIDSELYDRRCEDSQVFYCPNGHPQCFRASRVDQLEKQLKAEREKHQRQLEAQRKRAEWAEQGEKIAQRPATAYKGQVTKIRKRVAHGVCPCCNRTFENLARHIQTKHPEWANMPLSCTTLEKVKSL